MKNETVISKIWEIISDDLPMLKTALAEIKDAWETL